MNRAPIAFSQSNMNRLPSFLFGQGRTPCCDEPKGLNRSTAEEEIALKTSLEYLQGRWQRESVPKDRKNEGSGRVFHLPGNGYSVTQQYYRSFAPLIHSNSNQGERIQELSGFFSSMQLKGKRPSFPTRRWERHNKFIGPEAHLDLVPKLSRCRGTGCLGTLFNHCPSTV